RQAGDGHEITDPGSARAVARLLLPGEERSYGGQDYRAPDERWQLARGAVYTVAVRRQRRVPADGLPILHARGIPRRVTRDAPAAEQPGAGPAQERAQHGP